MSAAPEEMEQVAMFKLPRLAEERFSITNTRKLPANVSLQTHFAETEYEELTVTFKGTGLLKEMNITRKGNDSGLAARQVLTYSLEATSLEITEVGHAGPAVEVVA